jgi:hypothetical protein
MGVRDMMHWMDTTSASACVSSQPSKPPVSARIASRPPGWMMNSIALVAMAGMLDAYSAPGCLAIHAALFILLWVVLGAVWLLRISLFAGVCGRLRLPSWKETWRRWAMGPIIALITLLLVFFDVPLRLRFAASRGGLDRVAHDALAAGPRPRPVGGEDAPIQTVGLYDTTVEVTSDGEVRIRVPGTAFPHTCGGFVYSPTHAPQDPEDSFEPLSGGWYRGRMGW